MQQRFDKAVGRLVGRLADVAAQTAGGREQLKFFLGQNIIGAAVLRDMKDGEAPCGLPSLLLRLLLRPELVADALVLPLRKLVAHFIKDILQMLLQRFPLQVFAQSVVPPLVEPECNFRPALLHRRVLGQEVPHAVCVVGAVDRLTEKIVGRERHRNAGHAGMRRGTLAAHQSFRLSRGQRHKAARGHQGKDAANMGGQEITNRAWACVIRQFLPKRPDAVEQLLTMGGTAASRLSAPAARPAPAEIWRPPR